MKKIFFYLSLVFSTILFISCTSELNDTISNTDTKTNSNIIVQNNLVGLTRIDIPEGINMVNVYNWSNNEFLGTAIVEDNHIWLNSTNASLTVKLYDASKQQSSARKVRKVPSNSDWDLGYIKDAVVYKSEDGIMTITAAEKVKSGYSSDDFLSIFPAGKDNRNINAPKNSTNFTHDVVYTSNGNPFCIYPIYSMGWYDLTLGIFYYDENNERHDVNIWNMQKVGWKPSYEYISTHKMIDASKYTIVKTENAEGYQITLPEHYVYGFYVESHDDSQAGQYFSYSNENVCKEQHAVNIVDKNGINYLAFEDQENGDWDINDLICYINPKLEIIPNVTPEKIKEETEKIPTVIIVPNDIDKIVHGQDTLNDVDIEARYDNKGHDCVKIAVPLKNNEEIELDLDKMNQYCEADDFRIVTTGDETVIYCKDNSSSELDCGNSQIKVTNNCTENNYGKIIAYITGYDGKKDEDSKYEAKISLYPKNEDCFNQIIKCIENKEWNKLFLITKTKK